MCIKTHVRIGNLAVAMLTAATISNAHVYSTTREDQADCSSPSCLLVSSRYVLPAGQGAIVTRLFPTKF
jgi:hypothetical protein